MNEVMHKILRETIEIQLSKSPQRAKEFIDRWCKWDELTEYIASTLQKLGIKPYKEIRINL